MEYTIEELDKHLDDVADFEGGPAFPSSVEYGQHIFHGLTVRQYYAAKAMQTLLIDPAIPAYSVVAREAFAMADAMLEAGVSND